MAERLEVPNILVALESVASDGADVRRLLGVVGLYELHDGRSLSSREAFDSVDLFVLTVAGVASANDAIRRIRYARGVGYVGPLLVIGDVQLPHVEADFLYAGADDYVSFPSNGWAFLARVYRLVQRSNLRRIDRGVAAEILPTGSEKISLSNIEMRENDLALTIDGKFAQLTAIQFHIVAHLLARAGQWVRSSELQSDAIKLPATHQHDPSNVRYHINQIRARLAKLNKSCASFLHSERVLGYMWKVGCCDRPHCTRHVAASSRRDSEIRHITLLETGYRRQRKL
jgi:DNA-binding response OmpR family regulator